MFRVFSTILLTFLLVPSAIAQPPRLDPVKNADSPLLLDLPMSGSDPAKIDYAKLPKVETTHAVVSPPDTTLKFQLHNYLIHHDGRFWCMWSQGPPVEDEPSQHIRYSTSEDGLKWSEAKVLAAPPKEGYGFIARGFWEYNGELLALVAHFKGKGAFGVDKELKLLAFAYDKKAETWKPRGVLFENAINNFAPQKLPNGDWMMTRRDARFNVFVLIGGRKGLDDWQSFPVTSRTAVKGFSPDEPIWWDLPDKNLVALYRDNGGSGKLYRSFSSDNGKKWTTPTLTNFPNASSKIFSLRTSEGVRALISNANPKVGRRELYLSLSEDGLVFNAMGLLAIPSPRPSTLQYPHALEHDGHLFIAFSRNKATIEILKIPLRVLGELRKKTKPIEPKP